MAKLVSTLHNGEYEIADASARANKVDLNQGAENAGKTLVVGDDGKVTAGKAITVDPSLIIEGAAADAKATGEEINDLKSELNTSNDNFNANECYLGLIPNKYILRDTGAEQSYNGWMATGYIPIPPYCLLTHYIPPETNLVWGALYDENKNYISAKAWNNYSELSYFNNSDDMIYTRTSGTDAEMAQVKFYIHALTDAELVTKGLPADAKAVGDIFNTVDNRLSDVDNRLSDLESNTESVPNYYESQLTTKEATIRGHFDDCAMNGDGLVFLTDTHFSSDLFTSDNPTSYSNANNSFHLIKDIIAKCGIDKIVFGGDLVNSATNIDTMLLCMASFGNRWGDRQPRFRFCVGNHEYYTGNDLGQTTKPTPSELYGAGIKYNENVILGKDNQNTYFFDNTIQKVRYFVISCGRDTEVQNSQASWVMSEFEKIPSDYKVVLIGHAFMTDSMVAFRGRYKYILEAFDALKAKTQYLYDGVTYDYRSFENVTPVCAITGHTHIDGSLTTSGGIPVICTTCDSYAQNYELVDGTPTASPRTKGTTDEQAFDVFQFDFTNRVIYATRIGYGSDRQFSY